MKQHEAEKLIETIRSFVDEKPASRETSPTKPAVELHGGRHGGKSVDVGPALASLYDGAFPLKEIDAGETSNGRLRLTPEVLEVIYRQFRNRMIDELRVDPVFVQLLASSTEIEVVVQPRIVTLDDSSLKGRIAKLIARKFLDETRTHTAIRKEMMRTGPEPNSGNLSSALSDFVRDGLLTREGEGFLKAPGIKVTEKRVEA